MLSINSIIKASLAFISFYSWIFLFINIEFIIYIINKYNKKRTNIHCPTILKLSKIKIVIAELLFLIGFVNSLFIIFNIGNTIIGSIFEKNEYAEQYYVYLRKDATSSKCYKLKADILRINDSRDNNSHFVFMPECHYAIEKCYWNDSDCIYFDTCDGLNEVIPYKETLCYSLDSDEDLYITLTAEKFVE